MAGTTTAERATRAVTTEATTEATTKRRAQPAGA
jgi:hypothetical protein